MVSSGPPPLVIVGGRSGSAYSDCSLVDLRAAIATRTSKARTPFRATRLRQQRQIVPSAGNDGRAGGIVGAGAGSISHCISTSETDIYSIAGADQYLYAYAYSGSAYPYLHPLSRAYTQGYQDGGGRLH